MTAREVAEYLNVTVPTLYNWRVEGTGPRWFRVGRDVRYRREDLEEWLRERERS